MELPRDLRQEIYMYSMDTSTRRELGVSVEDLLELIGRRVPDLEAFLEEQLVNLHNNGNILPSVADVYQQLDGFSWRLQNGNDRWLSLTIEATAYPEEYDPDTSFEEILRYLPARIERVTPPQNTLEQYSITGDPNIIAKIREDLHRLMLQDSSPEEIGGVNIRSIVDYRP